MLITEIFSLLRENRCSLVHAVLIQ